MPKVFFVTNMYPSVDHTYNGIHVKEQIDCLQKDFAVKGMLYFVNGRRSKLNYIWSLVKANYLLLINKVDLIHIHFGLTGLFTLLNPFIKAPIVVTLHSGDIDPDKASMLMQFLTKLVVRRADCVIVLNDKTIGLLKPWQHKLQKIPCGISVTHFAQGRLNQMNNAFRVGFPGDRSRTVKNFPLFQEIVSDVGKRCPVEVIEFHKMTRSEVSAGLARLDCLLMTSIAEGSPQIIKEAMAGNIPVVSSNVGDVRDLLSGVANSWVVDDFEAGSFVSALNQLTAMNAEERKSNGLAKLRSLQLDQQAVCKRIFDLYNKLIYARNQSR